MDWMRMAVENTKRRLAEIQAAQTVEIDADSADCVPELTAVSYSCVPHPVYPWDPSVLRQLWQIDQDFRPLWINYVYKMSNKTTRIVGRHGIARKVNPEVLRMTNPELILLSDVKMPTMPCQGVTFDAPNFEPIQWYLNDETTEGPHKGSYLPFTSELVQWVRENYFVLSPAEFKKQFVTDVREKRSEAGAKVRQEHQRMHDELNRYVNKVLEHTSDAEIKEAYMPYALGQFKTKDKKPFVHLGS